MSDILDDLRFWGRSVAPCDAITDGHLIDIINNAAAEIERLRGIRSETRPHVVYRKGKMAPTGQPGMVFPNWDLGRSYWVSVHHTVNNPFVISTISREIEPEAPIIDVNE